MTLLHWRVMGEGAGGEQGWSFGDGHHLGTLNSQGTQEVMEQRTLMHSRCSGSLGSACPLTSSGLWPVG